LLYQQYVVVSNTKLFLLLCQRLFIFVVVSSTINYDIGERRRCAVDVAEFGLYIKSLREQKGLTLSKLAKLSGVSHPYLSQIENGRTKSVPSPDILKKLAGPLGKPQAELMVKAGHFTFVDWIAADEESPEKELVDAYTKELVENERKLKSKELTNFLQQTDITFNGHPLTADDRQRILDMLAVLFPDRK
jgi:HTH-type transcriptional regulator, competence development regulator